MPHRTRCLLAALTLASACSFKESSGDDTAAAADGADGTDGTDGADGTDGTEATLDGLAFEPPELVVFKGDTVSFTVVARWSDGTDADVTIDCALSIDDLTVATFDGPAVEGLAAGATTARCDLDGESAVADVVVSAAATGGAVELLGHGVAGAELWVGPADDSEDPWLADVSALADGSFVVDDLGVGVWRITPRLLGENDDCIGYDSCVVLDPTVAGTYYARVWPFDEDDGVAQYQFAVLDHTDADADGWGTYHDCDDTNADVHPWAEADEPTTGIDADCDRWVRPNPAEPDAIDEAGTDEATAGRVAVPIPNNPWANFYVLPYASRFTATLHDEDDVDWWSFQIPAFSYFYLDNGSSVFDRWGNTYGTVTYTLVDSDRTTVLDTSPYDLDIINDTATAKTLYLRAALTDAAPTTYYPALVDMGVDLDEDGYYTQDWGDDRDCDDADDSLIGGCAGAR